MVQGVEVAMNGPFRRRAGRVAAAGCLLGLALSAPAFAQDAKPTAAAGPVLKLELNRLETPSGAAADGCRAYLLVDNGKGPALKSLKVDLFAFDTEGVAQKRLAVELGPIQEKKTVVRLFDFPSIACPKIGRVLLNDVLACEGGDSSRESCLERIETTTKSSAEFAR